MSSDPLAIVSPQPGPAPVAPGLGTAAALAAVRAEFPALSRQHGGRAYSYLDGPGGTQVPRRTIEAMAAYLERSNANHEGAFPTSEESDAILAEAHAAAADFLGAAGPTEVAFGQNMTTLTFAVSRAIGRTLRPGDEIVVTRLDHDANVAPWLALEEERGVTMRWVEYQPRRLHSRPCGAGASPGNAHPCRCRGSGLERGRDDQPGPSHRRDGSRGRRVDVRRRRPRGAAHAHRRRGARCRLPRLLALQVLRSAPRAAVRQGRVPGAIRVLQGAARSARGARQMGDGHAARRVDRRIARNLRLPGLAGADIRRRRRCGDPKGRSQGSHANDPANRTWSRAPGARRPWPGSRD